MAAFISSEAHVMLEFPNKKTDFQTASLISYASRIKKNALLTSIRSNLNLKENNHLRLFKPAKKFVMPFHS